MVYSIDLCKNTITCGEPVEGLLPELVDPFLPEPVEPLLPELVEGLHLLTFSHGLPFDVAEGKLLRQCL